MLVLGLSSRSVGAETILVVGDSLSAGYGIRQEEAWPSLLERLLVSDPKFKNKNPRVINASISGETTAGGRNRLAPLLKQHRPDIVILELGANDGLRGLPIAAMQSNLNRMLDQIRSSGARAVLVGMRLPPNYGPFSEAFRQSFIDLAKQTDTPFVPFLLDRLSQTPAHYQTDGLHPTREAQLIVLDNVWPTLQSVLR